MLHKFAQHDFVPKYGRPTDECFRRVIYVGQYIGEEQELGSFDEEHNRVMEEIKSLEGSNLQVMMIPWAKAENSDEEIEAQQHLLEALAEGDGDPTELLADLGADRNKMIKRFAATIAIVRSTVMSGDMVIFDDLQQLFNVMNKQQATDLVNLVNVKGHHQGVSNVFLFQNFPSENSPIEQACHYLILLTRGGVTEREFARVVSHIQGDWAELRQRLGLWGRAGKRGQKKKGGVHDAGESSVKSRANAPECHIWFIVTDKTHAIYTNEDFGFVDSHGSTQSPGQSNGRKHGKPTGGGDVDQSVSKIRRRR